MNEEVKKRGVSRRKVTSMQKKLEAFIEASEDVKPSASQQDGGGARETTSQAPGQALLSEFSKLLDQLEQLNDSIAENQSEEEILRDYDAFLNLKIFQRAVHGKLTASQQSASGA